MQKVENTKRKFGSATYYFVTYDGDVPLLFTENEVEVAKRRAAVNPEDLPENSQKSRNGKILWIVICALSVAAVILKHIVTPK